MKDQNKAMFDDEEESHIFYFNHELAKQKAREIAMAALFKEFPVNFYTLDLDGYVLDVNEEMLKSLGYTRKEAISKHASQIIDDPLIWTNSKKVLATGKTIITDEVVRIPGGQDMIFLSAKSPLKNSKGKIVGLMGISIDVTKQRLLEEIEKEKEIADKTIIQLTSLAASIVHQLKTPLCGIKLAFDIIESRLKQLITGYCQGKQTGIIKDPLNSEQIDQIESYLKLVDQRIEKIDFIIKQQLLNLQQNKWSNAFFLRCSISEIIEDALEIYPYLDKEKTLVHWKAGSDFNIFCEKNLILHVIHNILQNAFESIHVANKGKITIWLEKGTIYNQVHIKDTGDGLSREGRGELFDLFYTTRDEGSGVGLNFCQSVMTGHRGNIKCRGRKNKYALFTLMFPAKVPQYVSAYNSESST